MAQDTKNAHILRSLSINMDRKSFLLLSMALFITKEPISNTKPLDMKDKHNFHIYLHEFAHKLNQVRSNEFYRSI